MSSPAQQLVPRETPLDPDKALNGYENRRRVGCVGWHRVFKPQEQLRRSEALDEVETLPAFRAEEDAEKSHKLPLSPCRRSHAGAMEWWKKATLQIRRVWVVVARRLGIRKHGLLQLRHEVKACKYNDVQVMWEMIHRSESELGRSPPRRQRRKRAFWKVVMGVSRMPYPCRGL